MKIGIRSIIDRLVKASHETPYAINVPENALKFIQKHFDPNASFLKERRSPNDAWSIQFDSMEEPVLFKAHPKDPWYNVNKNLELYRKQIDSTGYSQHVHHTWTNDPYGKWVPEPDNRSYRLYVNRLEEGFPLTADNFASRLTKDEQTHILKEAEDILHTLAAHNIDTTIPSAPENVLVRTKPKPGEKPLVITDWNAYIVGDLSELSPEAQVLKAAQNKQFLYESLNVQG